VTELFNEPRHIDYRNGIKALDEENFLWADRVGLHFTSLGLAGAPVVATREEIERRVKSFTDIRVSDAVPTELQILFEFARGAMVYGGYSFTLCIHLGGNNSVAFSKRPSRLRFPCSNLRLASRRSTKNFSGSRTTDTFRYPTWTNTTYFVNGEIGSLTLKRTPL
jgi:hypothetical protein